MLHIVVFCYFLKSSLRYQIMLKTISQSSQSDKYNAPKTEQNDIFFNDYAPRIFSSVSYLRRFCTVPFPVSSSVSLFSRCLITRRGVISPTPAVQCRAISDTGTGSPSTAVKAKSTKNHGPFLPVLSLWRRGLFPGAPPSLPRRRPHRRRRHHPPHLHIKLPHPAHQRHDGSFHRSRLFY